MIKLYETDSFLKECTATVTDLRIIDGRCEIALDRSIFFPEGGGQYADRGWIYVGKITSSGSETALEVIDGQEYPEGIYYTINGQINDSIRPGQEVLCKLDWQLRFSRMQQHSGEHILTGLIHDHFGYDNISFHLSDDEPITICFNGTLSENDLDKMEALANQAIYVNLPIIDTYPDEVTLAKLNYRSKKELTGQIRIITVGDPESIEESGLDYGQNAPGSPDNPTALDVCACCAPHVMSTGQVGIIKIISHQSYKGGIQLNVLCGGRAYEYFRTEHKLVNDLARSYSTSIDKLSGVISKDRDSLARTKEELATMKNDKLIESIIKLTDADAPCVFLEEAIPVLMKNAYNALADRFPERFCGVFAGSDDNGYRFYAGNPNLKSRELAAKMRDTLNAKGGGSDEMIQGQAPATRDNICDFFAGIG